MGIGESVGHVAQEPAGARLIAVDGAIHIAHRAGDGFHIGPVKDTIAEIDGTAGFIADGIGLVVRVRSIEAMNDPLLPVSLPIAVSVAHEPHVRRLHDEHAILIELEAGRAVQSVEEGGAFGELACLRINVEHDELVEVRRCGSRLRIRRPYGDPQSTAGVEIHLHRVDEVREFRL